MIAIRSAIFDQDFRKRPFRHNAEKLVAKGIQDSCKYFYCIRLRFHGVSRFWGFSSPSA